MMKNSKKILISGYFGFGNTGDEAILSAMVKDLRMQEPGVEIVVVSGNLEDTKIHHLVDTVALDDLQQISKIIMNSDLIILGGGGLFHDYWEFKPELVLTSQHVGMPFYGSIALLARIHHKPLMLYAVGIGPLKSENGKRLTRAIVDLAHTISVRDQGSKEVLRLIGANTENISVTADPAFRLQLSEPSKIIKDRVTHPGPILGVVLRYWDSDVSPTNCEEQIAKAIDGFLDSNNGTAVFLIFQERNDKYLNDYAVSERVCSSLDNHDRALILNGDYSPLEMSGLIAECDLLLSMRMHGIVFAINNEIPVVSLVYDPKIQHLMEQAGIEEYATPVNDADAKSIGSLLERVFNNSVSLKKQLRSARNILHDRAMKSVEIAISVLTELPSHKSLLTGEAEELLKHTTLSLSNNLLEMSEQYHSLKKLYQEKINALNVKSDLLEEQILHTRKEADQLTNLLDQKDSVIICLDSQLKEIKGSRGWKLLWGLWEVRSFLIPRGSYREKILIKARNIFRQNPLKAIEEGRRYLRRKISIKMSQEAFAFDLYKRSRCNMYPTDLSSLCLGNQNGLVSIVLPVHNGSEFVGEALDSVLDQTYANFELIVINDGSQDNTGDILDGYTDKDERIRVYHQENRKLPLTLSRGFQEARGEYLTWISHDNRLKPDFLEKMVACLKRHPQWDMIYANQDIIGEDGLPLTGSDYYRGYQRPPGSDHVHLPKDTAELNTRPNNFIGGAFMYRDRVAWLIGDYSPLRYTREDYDYWMRVNSLLTLRHADFQDPIYDYRFHSDSLTNQDEELGITKDRRNLMAFDDFRRDFYLSPLTWFIEEDNLPKVSLKEISHLKSSIVRAGHISAQLSQYTDFNLPHLFMPFVYIRITSSPDSTPPRPENLPPNTICALLCLSQTVDIPLTNGEDWDISLALDPDVTPDCSHSNSGWVFSNNLSPLFTAIDIRVRSHNLERIEKEIEQSKKPDCKISVIVCTHNRQEKIRDTLQSVAEQTLPQNDYEIIIVNNDPVNNQVISVVEELRNEYFSDYPDHLRLIDSPVLGLSHARNTGISEASGEVLYFLDDDATAAEDTLDLYWKAFSVNPNAGVIGGHIILEPPESMPMIWEDGWEKYWSHFVTDYPEYRVVDKWWDYPWGANWCARREALLRIGGFRSSYGRRGNDFSGGEEIIAAILINKLGYTIAILPQAKVIHHIDKTRFSLDHLKNTIKAGLFTEYQAQAQLHIPAETRALMAVNQINRAIIKNVSSIRPRATNNKANRMEALYYISARGRLLIRQITDTIRRLRKPITRT